MLKKGFLIRFLLSVVFISALSGHAFAEIDTSRPGPEDVPTEVKLDIFIVDIDEIDDAGQSFKANFFILATWKDERLIGSGENTTYNVEEVWNPDLQIINRQKIFTTFPEIVEVDSEGTVVYRQRYVGNFSQPLDLKDFPFDNQKLEFQIMSSGNTPEQVRLVEQNIGISEKLSIPDWDIQGFDVEKKVFRLIPALSAKEGMVVTVRAERYEQFYIYKFIVPLLLIVFMSWIVFWIDPADYTAQISISITSMLTLIAYQYLAVGSLPEVPYLTRIDSLMFLSTLLVFATLIEVTLTSVLTKKDRLQQARSIDYYCRFIFPAIFIFIFIMRIVYR